MSISAALSTSQSGLATLGKRAEVTSTNISNADRPGYVRRDVEVATGARNTGVGTNAISREIDRSLQSREWAETASAGYHAEMAQGISYFADQLGEPGSVTSLPSLISSLQSELDLLSVNPDDAIVQASVLRRAEGVTRGIGDAAGAIYTASQRAFNSIDRMVGEVNSLTSQIANLNVLVSASDPGTSERASLQDQQDAAIGKLAELVDLKLVNRGSEGIDILIPSGASLVEGNTSLEISFDRSAETLLAGAIDVTPGRAGTRGLAGGALAADVELYAQVFPDAQHQLDALAGSLITTFEAADTSLAFGQAGLFTDGGSAFDTANQDGLSSRIAINAAVDPDQGGRLSKLRDGIGASTPGALSDSTQVVAYIDAMGQQKNFDPALGLGGTVTLSSFAANFVTQPNLAAVESARQADAALTAIFAIQSERSAREGVNIDTEIQQLLAIEQAFAANSQVISALTRMMDDLLNAV
ncbi:flagellar hook-associated protein FlgK [Roseivivax sp. CAU 1753]